MEWSYLSIHKLEWLAVEVCKWISNFIPHFTGHVITYPCWGLRLNHASKRGTRNVFCSFHDDVIKWKHFPRYWPFVWGIHRSPVNSPNKGHWRGALMFSLICASIDGWVNNCEAGDFRCDLTHYDVTVTTLKKKVLWLHVCKYHFMELLIQWILLVE